MKVTKSESQPKPDSTYSDWTDFSARFDAVLALGCKLVDELSLGPSTDTLGRWMAHYVAALIERAETEPEEGKPLAQKECFEAILALWKHRAEFPNGRRPFEGLETIVRSLESLDPEDDQPRYFRSVSALPDKDVKESETRQWLSMVAGIDYTAKLLIAFCLAEAARAAIDKSAEWVKLAEAAGTEDSASELVIRFLETKADFGNKPDLHAKVRKQLQVRKDRLESFIELAKHTAEELAARIEDSPCFPENGESSAEEPSPRV